MPLHLFFLASLLCCSSCFLFLLGFRRNGRFSVKIFELFGSVCCLEFPCFVIKTNCLPPFYWLSCRGIALKSSNPTVTSNLLYSVLIVFLDSFWLRWLSGCNRFIIVELPWSNLRHCTQDEIATFLFLLYVYGS